MVVSGEGIRGLEVVSHSFARTAALFRSDSRRYDLGTPLPNAEKGQLSAGYSEGWRLSTTLLRRD